MANRLHPDVYIEEIGGRPVLLGVGVGTGCFVGTAPTGPTDEAVLITNYSQFVTAFGSDGGALDEAVKAFFDNGGSRCYVIRITGSGAAAPTATLDDCDVEGKYVGTELNGATVSTTRYTVMLDTGQTITSTDRSVDLVDASNVEIGDLINFYDGGAWVEIKVVEVSGNTIYFPQETVSGTIDDAVVGVCATDHKISTKSSNTLSNGVAVSQITLQSIGALEVGDFVHVCYYDSVAPESYYWGRIVTAISGNIVTLDSAFTPGVDMVPYVASVEFSINVTKNGEVVETRDNLSAQGTSPVSPRFYEDIVNNSGTQNISDYLSLSYGGAGDSDGNNVPYNAASPYDGSAVALSGGSDGATPVNDDYIGSDVNPKTGMGLAVDIREINMLSVPGQYAEAIILEGVSIAESKGTITFIYASSSGLSPTEVKQWRSTDVNVDSSYAALYWPWYNIDDGQGGNKLISPEGAVQGRWAFVAGEQNISVAPANITIANARSLEYKCSGREQDILHPLGINVIRDLGTRGIRIMGARTLTSLRDGRHYLNVRGLLNFVKATVYEGTQWAVYKNNDPSLWSRITNQVNAFLRSLWQEGMLYPSDDENRAYYVKCDSETNTPETIAEGKVITEIGVNAPYPAEFVVFKIGLWDGGGSITENV